MIRNGDVYESVYARGAACLLATMAPPPAEPGRLAAYELIRGLYQAVFDDPAALGWKPLPDAHFEPWEQQRGRERDVKSIRDAVAKTEALAAELFDLAEVSDALPDALLLPEGTAPKRPLTRALAAAGYKLLPGQRVKLALPEGCAEALRELCAVSRSNIIHITDGAKEDKAHLYFSRAVFDPAGDWTAQVFDALLNAEGRLVRLCCELERRGYRRIDCRDGKRVTVDYVKQHGKKAEPVKMAWGERSHSGIEVSFEELRREPGFVWVRMPMFKAVLASAERLPDSVRAFLARWAKSCDGCRYCVQTDKTGTRPLAALPLGGDAKCPLYPGFTMNWRELPQWLCDDILALLDALDALPELK